MSDCQPLVLGLHPLSTHLGPAEAFAEASCDPGIVLGASQAMSFDLGRPGGASWMLACLFHVPLSHQGLGHPGEV